MPGGGRGTIISIANSLNNATESKESMKMSIKGGYVVVSTFETLGAALSICDHKKELNEIYCYAYELGRVEPEY